MKMNPELTKDQAFEKCRKSALNAYKGTLKEIIKETKNLKTNQI